MPHTHRDPSAPSESPGTRLLPIGIRATGPTDDLIMEVLPSLSANPAAACTDSELAPAAGCAELNTKTTSYTLSEIWRGAWSRRTWTREATLRLLLAFAVLSCCSWLGIMLSHQSDAVATIWLTNGILFGLVITRPRQQWLGYFIAGLAADTLADVVYGDPFRLAIGVSVANSVEVITSCLILTRWFGVPLNLSRRRP